MKYLYLWISLMIDILDCNFWSFIFPFHWIVTIFRYPSHRLLMYRNSSDGNIGCNLTQEKKQQRKSSILIFQIMIIISNAKKKKVWLKMKWKSRNHKFISADGLLGTPVGKNSLFMIIFDNFYELFGLIFTAIKPSYQPQTLSKMYIHTYMKTLGANRIILEYTTN